MEAMKPKLGFDVTYDNGIARFVYEQAKHGAHLGCGLYILSFILTLILGAMLDPLWRITGKSVGIVFVVGCFIGAPILLLRHLNKKRGSREFLITKEDFVVEGKQFARSHISSIEAVLGQNEARTANWQQSGGTYIVTGGTGFAGTAMALGATAGAAAAQGGQVVGELLGSAIAKANAAITFRYGEETHVLAKGLTPKRAEVLFEKVLEACSKIK